MILIDTEGERVGQINGLAVYGADFYSFGRPTRITATVSLGSGSIINVEREAGMSGRHYNKGVLIISGYFRETFGQIFLFLLMPILYLNNLTERLMVTVLHAQKFLHFYLHYLEFPINNQLRLQVH